MEKRKIILPLLMGLLLCSCSEGPSLPSESGNPSSSDSGLIDSSESSSSPSASVFYTNMASRKKNAAYIYDFLCYVGTYGDYTLSYDFEGLASYDLFNSRYYYTSILQNGGVMLPRSEGDEILYRYEMNDGQVDVLLPENANGNPVGSVNDISYFSLFVDPSQKRFNLDESKIKMDEKGGYYIDDSVTNLTFASSVGYFSLAYNGLIKSTHFSFLETGDIAFTINALSLDGNGEYQETVLTTAKFSNVDCSKLDALEGFRASYAQGGTLPPSMAPVFSSSRLTAHSEVTLHVGNETPSPSATSDVFITPKELYVESKERGSERLYSHYYENQGGKAFIVGLTGKNEILEEDGGIAWNELSWPQDLFDAGSFVKIKENTYRYLGFEAEAFFYSFSYLDFAMAIKTMDLVVENESIKEIDTTLYRDVSDEDSSYIYYTIKTTFAPSADISRPAPYDGAGEEEDQAKIASAFSALHSGNRYEALMEDYGSLTSDKTRMTVSDNIVYFETYNAVTTEILSRKGFVEKEGKIIPFSVSADASGALIPTVSEKCKEGDTLDAHIGFAPSPLAFALNERSQIVTKPNVLSLSDVFMKGPGMDYVVPDTLSMPLNGDGQILNISYSYDAPAGYGQSYQGNARITFSRYGTAILPPNLTKKINQLTAKE